MRTISTALFIAFSAVGASSAEKQPIDSAKIVGRWRSVKLEGKDIGTRIIEIDATFADDGKVSMTAKLKAGDGKVKTETKNGEYRVIENELEMTIDKETRRSKSWFQNNLFVIQDPELDSRVHFERVKPKEKDD